MEAKGAFWSYVRQFRSHWLSAMSGAFSVPFTAAAVFSGEKYQQAIFGVLALAAFLFATFRVWKVQYDRTQQLEQALGETQRQSERGQRDQNSLKISVGTAPEFEEVMPRGDYVVRTVLACIENVDKSTFLSNCKFNMAVNGADYPPLPPFTLNATERRFLPVAVRHENGNDKFIHIRILVGGYVGNASDVTLPLIGGLVTLKATCAEARATQQVCRLYVDDTGRLRIEKA